MKSVFIINPHAGKPSGLKKLLLAIEKYYSDHPDDHEIRITTRPGEATQLARHYAKTGQPVRLFACGGDGTTFDVLNGMAGYDNALLGVIPKGTGNDFLRTFGYKEVFADLHNQLHGHVCKLDVIRAGDKLCINQASMGLDANVCANKDKFSKIPFIKGKTAYMLALFYCFLFRIKNHFQVQMDDQPPMEQDYLFSIAANGQCYGGGFCSAPLAHPADGKIDCITVESVSRFKILSLIKKYAAGRHLNLPICHYKQCQTVTVTATQKTPVNLDGEVHFAQSVTFEIVPAYVNFIIPHGAQLPKMPQAKETVRV